MESPPPAPPVQNFHHEPKVDNKREEIATQPIMDAGRLSFTIDLIDNFTCPGELGAQKFRSRVE